MFTKTIVMFLAILVSCTSAQKSNSSAFQEKQDLSPAVEKYKTLAMEKYKEGIDYVFNESGSFVMCVHAAKPSAEHPQKTISFFVYDLKNEKILYEESVGDGSVKWKNDVQIEITSKIGIITPSHQSNIIHYVYDVSTQKKLKK
ncbi:hypothetical protein JNL27_05525 [bacterium]|nr:hypothetical protein [bacterium]